MLNEFVAALADGDEHRCGRIARNRQWCRLCHQHCGGWVFDFPHFREAWQRLQLCLHVLDRTVCHEALQLRRRYDTDAERWPHIDAVTSIILELLGILPEVELPHSAEIN